jgi:serine/threonine protein kinase
MIREVKVLQTEIPNLKLENIQIQKDHIGLQMPFLENDLMGLMMNRQKFSQKQIIFLFKNIVKQVFDLHSSQLVHRDIKASNILLGKEGLPSLIDFGHTMSAKKFKFHPKCGTLSYLSPELLLFQKQNVQVENPKSGDMWALGCVLAEFFLGKPLFARCQTPGALTQAWEQIFGESPLIKQLRNINTSAKEISSNKSLKRYSLRRVFLSKCPDISETSLQLIESLLNPDPKLRPSCEEVLRILGEDSNDHLIRLEIQEILKTKKFNCLDFEMRNRLIAMRKSQKSGKNSISKNLEEIKRKPKNEVQEVKLGKRSNPSVPQEASSLKKIKMCQYREFKTPIN